MKLFDMLSAELLLALIVVVVFLQQEGHTLESRQMSSVQLLSEDSGSSILHSFMLGKGTNLVSQHFASFTLFRW